MRLITVLTLLFFASILLAIIWVSPILMIIWLIPKFVIPCADRLGVQSCYTYALRNFLHNKGSLIFTRSKYGWWFHIMWVDKEGNIWEWCDLKPGLAYRQWKPLPPLWFLGKVIKKGKIVKEV